MSDPVAQAAAQIASDAAPSSTEPSIIDEIKEGVHDLAEKVDHLIHPQAQEGGATSTGELVIAASSVETSGTQAVLQEPLTTQETDVSSAASAQAESQALTGTSTNAAQTAAPEHPHTPILRKIVGCLRRDFAMLPGELESWVKTAEENL